MVSRRRDVAPAAVAFAVLASLLAGIVSVSVPVPDEAVSWLCVAVVCVPTAWVLVRASRRGALLEPLPVVAFVTFVVLGLRPLQLLLARDDLLVYQRPTSSVGSLIGIDSQEIAYFVQRKLVVPLDVALRETLLLCAVFVVLTLVAYRFTPVRRFERAARLLVGRTRDLDMRLVVPAFLAVGLIGQAIVYVRIGGPGAALANILDQSNLAAGFLIFAMANFAPVGLLVWMAWHPPMDTRSRLLFAAAAVEVVGFYITLGSRSLALYPALMLLIVHHFRVRRIRTRSLVAVLGLVVVVASAYLGVRQATYNASVAAALRSSTSYLANPSAIANDNSAFDNLLQARVVIGSGVPFRDGRSLANSVTQFVPGFVWSDKPESNDIWFRKAVWQQRFLGGRPYTLVGEFWADFGWLGVLLGALCFGALVRVVSVFVPVRGETAPLSTVVLALSTLSLYVLLVGVYTIAAAFVIQYVVPLVLALLLARRSGPGRVGVRTS